ncbi:MAG: ribonuclease T [Gammaproteobacteria bacterium]|jgi:ribonuclease T|nr:MAG: ribonuclease T [Gammaproteobacteria bacterium]
MSEVQIEPGAVAGRFRGYMPVVIDVETAGFNAATDALLEVAAVLLHVDEAGKWQPGFTITRHIHPFPGANLDKASLDFTGIDPHHPFRKEIAVDEKDALHDIFKVVRQNIRDNGCKRAILVGHNAFFDLGFINAAVARTGIKRNPFHPFSTFDTVSLAGLAYGQTVLSRSVEAAGLVWDSGSAHAAYYDAEKTAELFCAIVNLWRDRLGA